jgi:phage tail sheath protein FI
MSFRFYDVLEDTLQKLDEWKTNDSVTKEDLIDSVKERVLTLMTHVITTPLIGTAYAYPGDIQNIDAWLEKP